MCEIGYVIQIPLNFVFKFVGIIIILLFSLIDFYHIISVILKSQMISNFMKHPVYKVTSELSMHVSS